MYSLLIRIHKWHRVATRSSQHTCQLGRQSHTSLLFGCGHYHEQILQGALASCKHPTLTPLVLARCCDDDEVCRNTNQSPQIRNARQLLLLHLSSQCLRKDTLAPFSLLPADSHLSHKVWKAEHTQIYTTDQIFERIQVQSCMMRGNIPEADMASNGLCQEIRIEGQCRLTFPVSSSCTTSKIPL